MSLFPVRRTMYGVPVTIADSQLLIPQPEWDVLANEARQAPSFAMQLQGKGSVCTNSWQLVYLLQLCCLHAQTLFLFCAEHTSK